MTSAHQLVDSHVHLWDPESRDHRWLRDEPTLNRAFLPEDFPVADSGHHGWVFVQADCAWNQSIDEVDWVHTLEADGAPIIAVVAGVQLEDSQNRGSVLDELDRRPLVSGVRRLLQDEDPGFALTPDHSAGVADAGAHGFVVDLCVRHHQIPEITELVGRHPGVQFVLDHLGKPPVGEGWSTTWADDLSRLALLPNVACKLSGLTSEAPRGTPQSAFVPWLAHALDSFGPDRCMFGGDWPVASLTTRYGLWMDVVLRAVHSHGASAEQIRSILAGNAATLYAPAARPTRVGASC
jgi:L-fuconolactonase